MEEVAILRDKVEDLLEEDKHALPTEQDYDRCADEKLAPRINELWAEADAKLVAELAKAKAAADSIHDAELAHVTKKLEEKVREVHELRHKLQHMTDSGIAEVGEDTSLSPSNVDGAIVVNRK